MPMLPFNDLKTQYARLKPAIDAQIQAVLDHGRFILGPEVAELEGRLADYAGCADAVCVSCGTDAMLIALMAEGVGRGDAVFLPAFTFTATAEVVILLGATPVFVDVDEGTYNIDPADLERRIEAVAAEGALRPRAVIAVDLFGLPADYEALAAIAERHALFLLADAAQSFGGVRDGRRVGTLAPLTATSFFPAKPLGCYGDGGAILVAEGAQAEVLRSIRAHGKGEGKYDIVRVGINGRLDTLQAAILLAKLDAFPAELEAREALARRYDAALGGLVALPERRPGATSAWAQYTVRTQGRDRIAAALSEAGIPTAVYYPRPLHLQPAYAGFGGGEGSLPVSEGLCATVLSLPMHGYMEPADFDRICGALARAVGGTIGTAGNPRDSMAR